MEHFPLPLDVMRLIFEKSRKLARADGRKRMETRICDVSQKLHRSKSHWTYEYWDANLVECEPSEAVAIIRYTRLPVEYTEPWRFLYIRCRADDPIIYCSGAYEIQEDEYEEYDDDDE
jgi:hypothetical protein